MSLGMVFKKFFSFGMSCLLWAKGNFLHSPLSPCFCPVSPSPQPGTLVITVGPSGLNLLVLFFSHFLFVCPFCMVFLEILLKFIFQITNSDFIYCVICSIELPILTRTSFSLIALLNSSLFVFYGYENFWICKNDN